MANNITATVEFSFKGETHRPTLTLDLDNLMQQHGIIPTLYSLLAEKHNIDSYSYEYEVMLSELIQFSEPTGLAKQFFIDDIFDHQAYAQQWQQQQILNQLRPILKAQLDIDDIEQQPALKTVLLATYQLAKNTP